MMIRFPTKLQINADTHYPTKLQISVDHPLPHLIPRSVDLLFPPNFKSLLTLLIPLNSKFCWSHCPTKLQSSVDPLPHQKSKLCWCPLSHQNPRFCWYVYSTKLQISVDPLSHQTSKFWWSVAPPNWHTLLTPLSHQTSNLCWRTSIHQTSNLCWSVVPPKFKALLVSVSRESNITTQRAPTGNESSCNVVSELNLSAKYAGTFTRWSWFIIERERRHTRWLKISARDVWWNFCSCIFRSLLCTFTILDCVVLLLKNVRSYVFSRVQTDSSSLGTRAQTVGRFKRNSSICGDTYTRASSAEKEKKLKSVSRAGSKIIAKVRLGLTYFFFYQMLWPI